MLFEKAQKINSINLFKKIETAILIDILLMKNKAINS